MKIKKNAILLIGPTGSGKSPIGNILERDALWPHFDFGNSLRSVASGDDDFGLTTEEIDYVRNLLEKNELLPDEKFNIAEKIITSLLKAHDDAERIVLNGLPRHESQAQDIAKFIDIDLIVYFKCNPEETTRKVRMRREGKSQDHTERTDDTDDQIKRKIEIFNKNTLPLLDYFQNEGILILELEITAKTTEAKLAERIVEAVN